MSDTYKIGLASSRFQNKNAIVTGGTRGIGYEITQALLVHGFRVAAVYRGNEAAAKDAKGKLDDLGFGDDHIKLYKANVGELEDCKSLINQIEKDLGPVSVLVNNAGITRDGFLHKMPEQDWDAVMTTNLKSVYNMLEMVLPGMRERQEGHVINMSSVNASLYPMGQANYAAAKAALEALTKVAARENASKGVAVNALAPGYTHTDMTGGMNPQALKNIEAQIPMGRLAAPEEMALGVILALLTPYTTGQIFRMNGGLHI